MLTAAPETIVGCNQRINQQSIDSQSAVIDIESTAHLWRERTSLRKLKFRLALFFYSRFLMGKTSRRTTISTYVQSQRVVKIFELVVSCSILAEPALSVQEMIIA